MQTPTHAVLAMVFLSKKNSPARNKAVLLGALLPDAYIYISWAWLSLKGVDQGRIWNQIYFESGVQFWDALSNSVPIYLGLAILGLMMRTKLWGVLLMFFALAALTHMATDFPVHVEDAHRHFWPLSDWRFHSPISYWDINHHGRIVGLLENLFGLGCVAFLLKRFSGQAARITLFIMLVLYSLSLVLRLLFISGVLPV